MSIYGVIAMVIFVVTFLNTKEIVPSTIKEEKTSFRSDLKGLTSQSIIFFIINFLYFGLYVIRNTTVIYYFTYNLGRTDWLTFVGLFGILSGLPILLVLPALQKRMSKKKVMFLSVLIAIVMWFYNLDGKRDKISAELERRRAGILAGK